MQSTEVYADSSCDDAVSMTVISSGTCTATDCTSLTIGTSAYYTETKCPSDVYEHAADVFEDTSYILMDIYSGTDCTTYIDTVAVAASGECEAASTDGQGVIATLFSNGSAELQYYVDTSCQFSASSAYELTADDLTSHTCNQARKFYSSLGGSSGIGSNSAAATASSTASSSSSSASSDSSSGLSGGAIAGIVVGCLVVLALLALLLWRRRRKTKQPSHDQHTDTFSRTDDLRDAFYRPHRSPSKRSSNQTDTNTNSTGRHSSRLWDDDVIVAARVPREKVILKQLINRGGYGEVYMGTYNGKQVAVKLLLPETKKHIPQVNAFLSEVKLMAGLDHPQIVSFVGVAWDSLTDLCVLSEYMAGGDLKALLGEFEKKGRPIGFDYDKVKIALHVSIALTYLHSCAPPVIHRDLKSKNILLDEKMNAKVTDFGISRERVDTTMTGGIGTSFWMAPEVMLGERYDDKADMFSFGVVLAELDSHVLPYSNIKGSNTSQQSKLPNAAILQMVASGKLRVEFSEAGPKSMIELGLACVSLDPKQRPTAAEALYKLQQVLARKELRRRDE